MAKRAIKAGSTDQTVDVFIQDSSSTTGAGLSGLAYNSSGLKCYYRKGATGSATALTLATQTVGGAHSDGGFVEIDATNMKGVYRLDLSDTIVAAAPWVTIYLYGATNMAPVALELEVVSFDPFDSVRLGLTALPNAAAEASGGLVTRGTGTGQISVSSGQVILQTGTGTGQLDFTSGVVKSNVTQISGSAVSTTTAQLGVNVVQVSGDSTAADNCESFFDGSGYGVHVARTTVSSVTSQTILMLNTGTISLAVANAYKGCMVIIRDHSDTKNVMFAVCTAYDESTGQLTIDSTSGATFTIAASNIVEFVLPTYAQDDRANDATTATYIDTEVAAIKAKTDSLTFTVAGKVDANATHVSGSAVSTSSAQIGVNVVNFGGSAGTFASGIPAVNATQISGDSTAADNAESFFDGTGFGSHVLRTTVANVTSQTIIGLASATTGVANAYKGCMVAIRDHTTPANVMFAVCTAYDEGTGDLTINPTTGATFTIATSNIVEILLPSFAEDDRTTLASGTSAATIADAVWDEARTGHTTAGTFGRYLDAQVSTISGAAAADPTYVDAAHTWTFPSAVQTTATRIINELIGFNGLACMDFTNVIPPEVAISTVDSATFANISGTEPTVGTTSVSTNLKKVLIPINATSATANTYTLSVKVTTTDSQEFTRKGQFTVA